MSMEKCLSNVLAPSCEALGVCSNTQSIRTVNRKKIVALLIKEKCHYTQRVER